MDYSMLVSCVQIFFCGRGICDNSTAAKTKTQPRNSRREKLWCRISQPDRAANTDSKLISRVAEVGSVRF